VKKQFFTTRSLRSLEPQRLRSERKNILDPVPGLNISGTGSKPAGVTKKAGSTYCFALLRDRDRYFIKGGHLYLKKI